MAEMTHEQWLRNAIAPDAVIFNVSPRMEAAIAWALAEVDRLRAERDALVEAMVGKYSGTDVDPEFPWRVRSVRLNGTFPSRAKAVAWLLKRPGLETETGRPVTPKPPPEPDRPDLRRVFEHRLGDLLANGYEGWWAAVDGHIVRAVRKTREQAWDAGFNKCGMGNFAVYRIEAEREGVLRG